MESTFGLKSSRLSSSKTASTVPTSTSESAASLTSTTVPTPSTSAPNIRLLTDLRYRYTCTAIRSRHHPYDDARRRGWRQYRHPRHVDELGVESEIPHPSERALGFARRRRGRGGRENFDRGWTALDGTGLWDRLTSTLNREEERAKPSLTESTCTPSVATLSTSRHGSETLPNGLPSDRELSMLDANEW